MTTTAIKLKRKNVKHILRWLRVNQINDNKAVVMVKGYNLDYDEYTGLDPEEDADIDAKDKTYEDFQLWLTTY